MTPKEKAEELINKFKDYVHGYVGSSMLTNTEYPEQILRQAKSVAIICVDEILKEANGDGFSWNINCYWNGEKYIPNQDWKQYWQSVKKYLEIK